MPSELDRLREENAILRSKLLAIEGLCPFCKQNPAPLLCDAYLGMEVDPAHLPEHRYFKSDGESYTCDLMICEECRTQGAAIFFNGGDDPADHEIFVPDFCPIHHGCELLGEMLPRITKEDADVWRRRATIAVEMGAWRVVPPRPVDVSPPDRPRGNGPQPPKAA